MTDRSEQMAIQNIRLGKLVQLALNGIFNFSEFPIRFLTLLGSSAIISSVVYFIVVVIRSFRERGD
jgi:dolichol-phosphate mannosyltransferase